MLDLTQSVTRLLTFPNKELLKTLSQRFTDSLKPKRKNPIRKQSEKISVFIKEEQNVNDNKKEHQNKGRNHDSNKLRVCSSKMTINPPNRDLKSRQSQFASTIRLMSANTSGAEFKLNKSGGFQPVEYI